MKINIVCPHCEIQGSSNILNEGEFEINCPSCNKSYQVIIGTVRSKRSRGQKSANTRVFDLRYRTENQEDFLQFENIDYQDIELRSKDQFVLAFIENKPRMIQNLTIAKFWRLNTPDELAYQMILWGIVGLVIIVLIAATSS